MANKYGRAEKKEQKKEDKERGKDIEAGQKIDKGTTMSGREAARWARRINGHTR
jgi:hypothetical protein